MNPPAAWHPDPLGRHEYRYWDGERWTEHVADAGQVSSDPLDTGTAAGAADDGEPAADRGTGGGASEAGATAGTGFAAPDAGRPGSERGPADQSTRSQSGGWTDQQPAGGWSQQPAGGWSGQPAPGWSGQQASAGRAAPQSNGVAVAALVVGILSLAIAWFPVLGLLGAVGGIVAVILGFVGRGNAKRGAPSGGMALSGIITGSVAILLAVVVTVLVFAFGRSLFGDAIADYEQCIEETGNPAQCDEELEENLFDRWFGEP